MRSKDWCVSIALILLDTGTHMPNRSCLYTQTNFIYTYTLRLCMLHCVLIHILFVWQRHHERFSPYSKSISSATICFRKLVPGALVSAAHSINIELSVFSLGIHYRVVRGNILLDGFPPRHSTINSFLKCRHVSNLRHRFGSVVFYGCINYIL